MWPWTCGTCTTRARCAKAASNTTPWGGPEAERGDGGLPVTGFVLPPRAARNLAAPEGVDLARLLLGDWWKEEDLPLDWERFLPGGPLHAEVGFGGGELLLAMAARDP